MAAPRPSHFPHEMLGHIFSFCDVPTLAAVGRVSLACLELSSPFLYNHIELKDKKSAELLFCESEPSSERVGTLLSLARVKTLAIFYNPEGEILSRDRLSSEAKLGLKLDALKLVIEGACSEAAASTTALTVRPVVDFDVRPDEHHSVVALHALLSMLDPKSFLLVLNSARAYANFFRPAGRFQDDLMWPRLRTVVVAGSAFLTDLNLAKDDLGASGFHDEPEQKSHRVWAASAVDSKNLLLLLTVRGLKATVEVKPDGYDGWWKDQQAKKHK